jgi:hypothetical protein
MNNDTLLCSFGEFSQKIREELLSISSAAGAKTTANRRPDPRRSVVQPNESCQTIIALPSA